MRCRVLTGRPSSVSRKLGREASAPRHGGELPLLPRIGRVSGPGDLRTSGALGAGGRMGPALGKWNEEGLAECEFFKVEAIFRPWRLPAVICKLSKEGIKGMTASDVRGLGMQGDVLERYAGNAFGDAALVEKTKLEVVCTRSQVQDVIDVIIEESRTGEIGDGKIFVQPVSDVIRIRTGESGLEAEYMKGGRSDTLAI